MDIGKQVDMILITGSAEAPVYRKRPVYSIELFWPVRGIT